MRVTLTELDLNAITATPDKVQNYKNAAINSNEISGINQTYYLTKNMPKGDISQSNEALRFAIDDFMDFNDASHTAFMGLYLNLDLDKTIKVLKDYFNDTLGELAGNESFDANDLKNKGIILQDFSQFRDRDGYLINPNDYAKKDGRITQEVAFASFIIQHKFEDVGVGKLNINGLRAFGTKEQRQDLEKFLEENAVKKWRFGSSIGELLMLGNFETDIEVFKKKYLELKAKNEEDLKGPTDEEFKEEFIAKVVNSNSEPDEPGKPKTDRPKRTPITGKSRDYNTFKNHSEIYKEHFINKMLGGELKSNASFRDFMILINKANVQI